MKTRDEGCAYFQPQAAPKAFHGTIEAIASFVQRVVNVPCVWLGYLIMPFQNKTARLKSFASSAGMWILPGITGILGIAFLGAVLVVRRVMFTSDEASSPTIHLA